MDFKHLSKYKIAIILGILAVVAVAYFDLQSATSGVFGSFDDYTHGNYTNGWWGLFKIFVLFVFAIVPVCYYFFYKKDKSETLAIFLTSYLLWMFGFADILYFWFQGQAVPQTLPWLVGQPVLSKISGFLHTAEITSMTLYVSTILGFVLVYFSTKILRRIN